MWRGGGLEPGNQDRLHRDHQYSRRHPPHHNLHAHCVLRKQQVRDCIIYLLSWASLSLIV